MGTRTARRGSRLTRVLGVVVVAVALAGPSPGPVPLLAREPEPLDLAAMTLTPAEAEGAGFEGYRLWSGRRYAPDEVAAFFARDWNEPEAEVRDALARAGLIGFYNADLLRAAGPDFAPTAAPLRAVRTGVYAFADAAGAAEGFAYLLAGRDAAGATRLADAPALGDEAALLRGQFVRPNAREAVPWLEATFRRDNVVAGATIYAYAGEGPTLEEVARLGAVHDGRVETVLAGGGPGLSPLVVRLEGSAVTTAQERYDLLAGDPIPFVGEPAEARERRREGYGDATDAFALAQHLDVGAAADDEHGTVYRTVLYRFPDEAGARAWLRAVPERLGEDRKLTDVTLAEATNDVGDEGLALTLVDRGGDADLWERRVYVRVDEIVALVAIGAPERHPPASAADQIAAVQATCLEAGACGDPLPIPTALRDRTEATAEPEPPTDPTAEPTEAPTAGATGDGGTYVSEHHGYAVTDGAAWEVQDDETTEDAAENPSICCA